MAALLIAGTVPFFGLTPYLAAAVALLLAVVVVSYRQTLSAYPGGGAYTVAGDNLGPTAGRTAGRGFAARLRVERGGLRISGRGRRLCPFSPTTAFKPNALPFHSLCVFWRSLRS